MCCKTFRDIKDKTPWMAKVLAGVGDALILAGRGDEAKSYVDEALSLSRELKNDGMVAESLGVQGDMFFYAGDFKSQMLPIRRRFRRPLAAKSPTPS